MGIKNDEDIVAKPMLEVACTTVVPAEAEVIVTVQLDDVEPPE